MLRKTFLLTIVSLALVSLLVFAGCSDDTISSGNLDYTAGSGVEIWFPLDEGYTSTFQVDYSNGSSETVSFEVGEEVQFGYQTAHEWIIESSTGEISRTYLVASDQALYFYENVRSTAEKIISLPMTPGETWNRFSVAGTDDEDGSVGTGGDVTFGTFEDKFGDPGGPLDPLKDGDNVTAKSFPATGGNVMTVEAVGSVPLSTGNSYTGAVRVTNSGANGKNNYYWYAPGIGLVRYVIGASNSDAITGQTVGELISYGS